MEKIPEKLENHCRKTRSTFLCRPELDFEMNSLDFDLSNISHDEDKIECALYNGMNARDASNEFVSVYDDLIRYSNSSLYLQLKDIYCREFSEESFDNEIFSVLEKKMPIISESLDLLESNLERCLSVKNNLKLVIALILSEKKHKSSSNANKNSNNNIKNNNNTEDAKIHNKRNNLSDQENELKIFQNNDQEIDYNERLNNIYNDFIIEALRNTDPSDDIFQRELQEYDRLNDEIKELEYELELKTKYNDKVEELLNNKNKITNINNKQQEFNSNMCDNELNTINTKFDYTIVKKDYNKIKTKLTNLH